MTVGWILILAGLVLCWWMGNKNRRLRKELGEQRLRSRDFDREEELIAAEKTFTPKYRRVTGKILREGKAADKGRRQHPGNKKIRGIVYLEGWRPNGSRKKCQPKGQMTEEKSEVQAGQNRELFLATTGDFLYNRSSRGRVIPFPTDHRGGA